MREILFRGKRIIGGEWLYGSLLTDNSGEKHIIPFKEIYMDGHHVCIESDWPQFFDQRTIGQFTGLLDKHGIKIFEGDIVKATYDYGPAGEIERIVEVVFSSFGTNLQDWIFKEDGYLPEIIGNIHDNTELVEVTE